ncbi:PREDICTED: dual specificity mitogen-activated protein kinase kinase 5-like [Amphimedon queenslandica]|uniref:Protein kinase domain-containing protein n=1 Tax=Amphimedon queenslandica TaxID=400682 RepID=A0AAN0JFT2_AMPQE|nr:PREDICTED: dual specificity mitogen-activated protein kinase kinase 5-like [Amphimedon queenslandica]|eukprot:XP_019855661.1 PREDICTED: dual specificity mitogen-activated protein kinase kinase 5-like [Amphimedon queenslandica]
MSQVLLNTTPLPTAFEYEDEDGDYITVSNDDELFALLSYSQCKCEHYGVAAIPISIYPKVQRVRNPLMLEVNTDASSLTIESVNTCNESGSQRSADEQALINLLSGGQISPQELQFLEILGHGSGGTVYRTFHSPTKVVMAVKVSKLHLLLY